VHSAAPIFGSSRVSASTPPDPVAHTQKLCGDALAELFPKLIRSGEVVVFESRDLDPSVDRAEQIHVASSLQLEGEGMRLILTLVAEPATLDKLMPKILKSLPQPPCLCDWTGELVNQLGGRLQGELARRGPSLDLGIPNSVLGRRQLRPVKSEAEAWHVFSVAGDHLWIRLQISIDRGFVWPSLKSTRAHKWRL
jgi:hypothetical protein